MADTTRKVVININTKGDPRGAKDVARALNDITLSQEKIGVENIAFYDLDAALKKTTASAQAAEIQTKKTAAAKSNFGSKITQVGFQMQDFAVQVGSGTSALTALAQQGSQLLGILGPQGALAGAALAIGAVLIQSFSGAATSAETAKQNAEALALAIDQIRENAEAASKEEIDFAIGAITAATTQAAELRDRFKETLAAQTAYETAALSNVEKVRVAMEELDRLQGKRVDDLASIQAKEDAAAALRELRARQEIEAANKRQQDAADTESGLASQRDETAKLFAKESERLDLLRERLTALREEVSLRSKFEEELRGGAIKQTLKGFGDAMTPGTPFEDMLKGFGPKPEQLAEMSSIEGRIADLEKQLSQGGEIFDSLAETSQEFAAANVRLLDVTNATAITAQKVTEDLQAADIEGKVGTVKAQVDATIQNLEKFVSDFNATTEVQKKAETDITQAIADGTIAADEVFKVTGALKILLGTMKLNETENRSVVDGLIRMVEQNAIKLQEQAIKVRGLEERFGQGQPIR
jgi:hypothetical protein